MPFSSYCNSAPPEPREPRLLSSRHKTIGCLAEVAMFGCEGLFGLLTAVVSREAFGRYVVQIPGTVSRIALDVMHEAIRTRPTLQRRVLAYNEALLAQAYHTVACNAVHPVEARCCRWILSTHDRLDQDALPLTHEFLAEMLGVQRSTVSSVLRSCNLWVHHAASRRDRRD